MDGDLAAVELVGDRVDQERHVVVHDLHDGVAALESMVGGCRVEDPDLGHARQPAAGEGQQRDGGAGALVRGGGHEVLVGDAAEEAAGEPGGRLAASPMRVRRDGIEAVDARRRGSGHSLSVLHD